MIFELNGPCHCSVVIPISWIEWLAPSYIYHHKFGHSIEEEKEEYPYDLYYMGEKVGKIKWPLQFPECTVEKIFEVK